LAPDNRERKLIDRFREAMRERHYSSKKLAAGRCCRSDG